VLAAFGVVIVAATVYDLLTSASRQHPHHYDATVNSSITSDGAENRESLITDLPGPLYGIETDVPLVSVASRQKRVCGICILCIFSHSYAAVVFLDLIYSCINRRSVYA